MLALLFLLWSLIRGLRKPSGGQPAAPSPTSSSSTTTTVSPVPEPEFQVLSEMSQRSRVSTTESYRSRYSPFSRESSLEVSAGVAPAGESRHPSVTSLSSYSTSSRRYEIVGQKSLDSRSSVTSLWSSDVSRRDSEAIPEHEVDYSTTTESRASSAEGARRHSEGLGRRRRSSARTSQVRRHTRRFPLGYDRRRTTGRFVHWTGGYTFGGQNV